MKIGAAVVALFDKSHFYDKDVFLSQKIAYTFKCLIHKHYCEFAHFFQERKFSFTEVAVKFFELTSVVNLFKSILENELHFLL